MEGHMENNRERSMEGNMEGNMDENKEGCCKHKLRQPEEVRDLMNRLNRIEGQVRGIKNMVEADRYCVDIFTQVTAIQAALNSFNKRLLSSHIKTCVVDQIRQGDLQVVEELCDTIQKVMK